MYCIWSKLKQEAQLSQTTRAMLADVTRILLRVEWVKQAIDIGGCPLPKKGSLGAVRTPQKKIDFCKNGAIYCVF